MSRFQLAGVLACVLGLADSASAQRSLAEILPTTVGLPEARIYAAFGTPVRSVPTPDGGKMVEFVERHAFSVPTGSSSESLRHCGPEQHDTEGTPLGRDFRATTTTRRQECLDFNAGSRTSHATVEWTCRMTFVIDRAGVVRSASHRGDLCSRTPGR